MRSSVLGLVDALQTRGARATFTNRTLLAARVARFSKALAMNIQVFHSTDPGSACNQDILEIAKMHDQQLRATRQDLVRAETRLQSEKRWRWLDRLAGVVGGTLLSLAALQAHFTDHLARAATAGAAYLATTSQSGIVFGAVIVPTTSIMMAATGFVGLQIFVAFAFRRPSPRAAAQKLMRRLSSGGKLTAHAFADVDIDDVANDIRHFLRRRRAGQNGVRLPVNAPTLESSISSLLHQPNAGFDETTRR